MDDDRKPRLLGVNHVALEVGDIEAALEFYGKVFRFELRGRGQGQAFLDMGDQFLALMEGRRQGADEHRHFGLVVDDRSRVRELAQAAGATLSGARSSTSSTRGATASRSSTTKTSSSPRRRTCCTAWAWITSPSPTGPKRSWRTRAWVEGSRPSFMAGQPLGQEAATVVDTRSRGCGDPGHSRIVSRGGVFGAPPSYRLTTAAPAQRRRMASLGRAEG